VDRDVMFVLAGGLIGLLSSVVALSLQRLWAIRDRRNRPDRAALDVAVRALMAWQATALAALNGKQNVDAEQRLVKLDERWEADATLIPDREAAEELLRRCKLILLAPRGARESPAVNAEFDELIRLGDRVLNSARERRRELA
jgi:hypothetical protein